MKLMYNPKEDIIGLLVTENLIKIQDDAGIYRVNSNSWIEVGEL